MAVVALQVMVHNLNTCKHFAFHGTQSHTRCAPPPTCPIELPEIDQGVCMHIEPNDLEFLIPYLDFEVTHPRMCTHHMHAAASINTDFPHTIFIHTTIHYPILDLKVDQDTWRNGEQVCVCACMFKCVRACRYICLSSLRTTMPRFVLSYFHNLFSTSNSGRI